MPSSDAGLSTKEASSVITWTLGVLVAVWIVASNVVPAEYSHLRALAKGLPALGLATCAKKFGPKGSGYSAAVARGLQLCALGDTLLAVEKDEALKNAAGAQLFFLAGLSVFLLGHVAFGFAFVRAGGTGALPLSGAVLYSYAYAMFRVISGSGSAAVPDGVAVYAAVGVTMAHRSLALLDATKRQAASGAAVRSPEATAAGENDTVAVAAHAAAQCSCSALVAACADFSPAGSCDRLLPLRRLRLLPRRAPLIPAV